MHLYNLDVREKLDLFHLHDIIGNQQLTIGISEFVREKVQKNRSFLEKRIYDTEDIYYGINTGFGSLCNIKISDSDLEKLQENLVLSHACGAGAEIPEEIARMIFFLKVRNLAYGVSGVRLELLEKLVEIFNAGITPVIYEMGSLGASGDLAPLAHLSLTLIGRGEVYYQGRREKSNEALRTAGIAPLSLKAKEGLALLNGTQFSLAYAVECHRLAYRFFHISNMIAALSMEAFHCNIQPFHPLLHEIRPHQGQQRVAGYLYELLKDSPVRNIPLKSVQDPYSFRCVPQVHGATWQAIAHAAEVINTELNSVTDNPNVFDDAELVLSGGNFHAQPLALVLDYLAIAMAELGSISERRVYQLINGDRDLPPFLTSNPGINSGFMIAQYTAASIVSQNKQYCTPASVDSIISSKGQEDHVSMAANAGTKCLKVARNVKTLLAIELLTACQAMEFRKSDRTSPKLQELLEYVRSRITLSPTDKLLHDDILLAEQIIDEIDWK
ncbi:MAG: histidine ammonia-lyase [Saprospiraceae bacterium]|nr:histidine ammonia-lyase [Saprospiraceae bacterium]